MAESGQRLNKSAAKPVKTIEYSIDELEKSLHKQLKMIDLLRSAIVTRRETWVALDGDDIWEAWDAASSLEDEHGNTMFAFAKNIEATIKQKNT